MDKKKVLKEVLENHKFEKELSWEEEIGIIGMEIMDLTLKKVEEIIDKSIQKPHVMVGGTMKSNHIFRQGRKQSLRELKLRLTRGQSNG